MLKKVDEIIIPENRQRRVFDEDKLRELRTSILSKGLLHPIVLRNDGETLLAGERRYLAIKGLMKPYTFQGEEVPQQHIPVTLAKELTTFELEEAELEENTIRVDLTWQERDAAIARLHKFRTKQADASGAVQTKKATLEELLGHSGSTGQATEVVSNALLIDEHLNDPDIAQAKSRKEALSLIKKKVTREHNAKIAQTLQGVKSRHELHNTSCLTFLPKLADNVFDCICTDPPYGINANTFKPLSGSNSGTEHAYDDSFESAHKIWDTILREGFRITKEQAHLYMFCDFRFFPHLQKLAFDAGWTPWPRPIIWHKPSGGMLGDSQHGPRMSYETILYANKNRKKVKGVYLDVVIANPADSSDHAAAKPVDLILNLLRRSCSAGDTVLDPCCGSGPIFPAADQLSLYATGVEIDETHYNTALAQMKGAKE